MKFKEWFIKNEMNLNSLLSPVPQSPIHHVEGDVWKHTKMVRGQLNDAMNHFKELVRTNPHFSNFSPEFTKQEVNLLRIGALLHDAGKESATTIQVNDKDGKIVSRRSWNEPGEPGKIQALAHEMPEHFEKSMQKLSDYWKNLYAKSTQEEKDDLWFMIRWHMDLHELFGKKLVNMLSENGKYKNERKVKLLLVLILMDQTGRIALDDKGGQYRDSFRSVSDRMSDSIKKVYKPVVAKQEPDNPVDFAAFLRAKGLPENQIDGIVKKKFGAIS